MKKSIIVFGASNSQNSINKKLANYAAQHLKQINYQLIDLNDYEMSLYGIDRQKAEGIPEKALELSSLFDKADGFLVSLAEHNGSYTVAFKNIYDWLSRINVKVWRNKPVLLLSTAPGKRGGKSVMESAITRFPFMGAQITGSFSLPYFYENFSKEKGIKNETFKANLLDAITTFEQQLEETTVLSLE